MNLFLKYKKILYILIPLSLIWGIYYNLKNNLPWVVEKTLKVALGPEISSKSITFPKFGVIDIKDVVLKDKGDIIVKAPEIKITYSKNSLFALRLEEINVYNPDVKIVRDDSDINIVTAFTGPSSNSEKKEDKKKSGSAVPIGKINVYNANLTFIDLSYSRPIEKKLVDTNGFVAFDKKTGIDLEFKGKNEQEVITYSFNDLSEKYDMTIKLQNVILNSALLQYGYDDKNIETVNGIIDMNLQITPKGLYGRADFKNGDVVYLDLLSPVKNINGYVNFLGERINVEADYKVFNKDGKFSVNYDSGSGVNVDFKLNNITYSEAEEYTLLKSLDLPLKNLNFKNVNINLNYNEKKEFKVTIGFDSDLYKIDNIEFSKIDGKFIYANDKFYLDKIKFKLSYPNEYIDIQKDVEIYSEIESDENAVNFKVESNIISINGIYDKSTELLEINQNENPIFIYDVKNKNLITGNLEIENIFDKYNFALTAREEEDIIYLDRFMLEKDDEIINIFGFLDTISKNYDFDFYGENFNSDGIKNIGDTVFQGNFLGKIIGEKEKFKLELQLEDINIEKNFKIEGFRGYVFAEQSEKLAVNFQGSVEKVAYDKYFIDGVKFGGGYADNKVTILNIGNGLFSVNGEYDILKSNINLSYFIESLTSERLNIDEINFVINEAEGTIKGDVKNPEVISNIVSANIESPNGSQANVSGKINFKNSNLKIEKININESFIEGNYSFGDKKGTMIVQLFEEELNRYYADKSFNYRLIGRAKIDIDNKNIKAIGGLGLDRGYFKGEAIPKLKTNFEYISNDFFNGILNLKNLEILNSRDENILSGNGSVNLKDRRIDFSIKDQKVILKKLDKYLKNDTISGDFLLNSFVKGSFNDLKYGVEISKGIVKVSDVEFDGVQAQILGDLNQINLNYLRFKYLGNSLENRGSYSFDNGVYSFSAESSRIDLSFLNILFKRYGIENISGSSKLNLTLGNNSNTGYFSIDNLNVYSKKYGVSLEKLNMSAELNGKYLNLNNFSGILNDGEISSKGYLKIPSIYDIEENPEFYKDLDYSLYFDMKNIKYQYEDYFNLTLSSSMSFKESKIMGNLSIDRGEIKAIPNATKSLLNIVLKFLFDKTRSVINRSKDLGSDFEIYTEIENSVEIDIGVDIKDGIILDIAQLNPFVDDVKGEIFGRGKFTGKGSKILFTGEVEAKKSSLVLGGNQYILSRAMMVFNDRNDYIPNVNPTIILEAYSLLDSGRIDLSLFGTLKDLTFNIKTNQGVSSSNLSRLFTGEDIESETTATSFIMKTIIDSQISNMLLRPISSTVKDMFGISKFRIVSNIMNFADPVQNQEAGNDNMFGFGASLEAENPIYKDNYFWVAKVGIIEPGNKSNQNMSNAVNEYDFKVERRFPSGWSWGVGVSKIPNESIIQNENKNGILNYYIDFKFERKYNSLVDIFKRE